MRVDGEPNNLDSNVFAPQNRQEETEEDTPDVLNRATNEPARHGRLGGLRELLAGVDADGWNSLSGREVVRLIRRHCATESTRWINRAGNLGEVGVAPVWVALAEWWRAIGALTLALCSG